MTELLFKGKEFVFNHHLTVPYRPLEPHPDKGVGDVDLNGNLIIQGDNLHALKALMPIYAGKVDCIFIDPPYNTGNEKWCYNDNVNAPQIKAWLNDNPISVDDALRHDKWCAMMWPRLRLLHELLAETGVIFVAIDDNEMHRLRLLMTDIFGAGNFICSIAVRLNPRGRSLDRHFAKTHEYILVFAKDYLACSINQVPKDDRAVAEYRRKDSIGPHRLLELRNRNPVFSRKNRPNLFFPVWVNESDGSVSVKESESHAVRVLPRNSRNEDGCWTWGPEKAKNDIDLLLAVKTKKGKWRVFRKDYLPDGGAKTLPKALWLEPEINNENGKQALRNILGKAAFDFPKSVSLISKCVELGSPKNGLILDSFAGSGTTGEAVMQANSVDDGTRKFILVEMENHIADRVCAERARRVIAGYKYSGKQRQLITRERLTLSKLNNWEVSKDSIEKIVEKQGKKFDSIDWEIKGNLVSVYGLRHITDKVPGLGGTFTYCTLGEEMEMKTLLAGDNLPEFSALGPVLFHIATNSPIDHAKMRPKDFYLGETAFAHFWLIYEPDVRFLKSSDAALTLSRARDIAAHDPEKQHLVFAPARFVSRKLLAEEGLAVDSISLPDTLYRMVQA